MIELIITIMIVSILVALGSPSFKNLVTEHRLKQASENLFSDLRYAQAEAVKRRVAVTFVVSSGSNWCYGFTDSSTCDCSISNSCQLNSTEKVVRCSNYTNISMSSSTISTGKLSFSATKGVVDNAGAITFTQNSKDVKVSINNLGFISLCSNTIVGYGAC